MAQKHLDPEDPDPQHGNGIFRSLRYVVKFPTYRYLAKIYNSQSEKSGKPMVMVIEM